MSAKNSSVDEMLRIAKRTQPDLWRRTEGVARIIAPEAFEDGWTFAEPASAAKLHRLRLKVQQDVAMSKAHDVLTYLGVNTETDWYEILTQLAESHG